MSQHGDDYSNQHCLEKTANLFTGNFISTFYHEPKDKKKFPGELEINTLGNFAYHPV